MGLFKNPITGLLITVCFALNAKAQSISGVVNSYYQVTAINSATNTITVSNSTGLTSQTRVLLMQMKGAAINGSNNASYGNITSINNAGNYEMNTICSVSGNDILLKYQMLNSYTVSGAVQLVSVPSFKSVTVSGAIQGTAWDPSSNTGGIVAIEASDTIYLNNNIDVSGQGLIGAALQNYTNCDWFAPVSDYYLPYQTTDYNAAKKGEGIAAYITNEGYARGNLANGGGGGNNHNTGGGGGANYGSGGNGGQRANVSTYGCHGDYPGMGGAGLSAYGYSSVQNKVFLGGGGGAGHENNNVGLPGGNGGGIVLLSAKVITGIGVSILANGARPINPSNTDPYQAEGDGAGGGGAAGTVLINANTVLGSIGIQANGANGANAGNNINDCPGPGGGGGGGIVWVSGASFPTTISSSTNGGASGTVSLTSSISSCKGLPDGATAGTSGISQANYVLPSATVAICVPLPLPGLKKFSANLTNDGAILYWVMEDIENVASYQIQFSTDQSSYQSIATIDNKGGYDFSYTDPRKFEGTIYYRLMMVKTDGSSYYSEIVPLSRPTEHLLQFISIQPNPASTNLYANLYAQKQETVNWVIYNALGQTQFSTNSLIHEGYNQVSLNISRLSSGVYYLKLITHDVITVKPFIRQ
ncbi:MAG: T9SS type A sorting domain-containing protein [Bacteroidetes bacterium]|nr:T9SS type A sorting domain-containing protein [Bacteroidota bacterium]